MTSYYTESQVAGIILGDPNNTRYRALITQEGPYADKDVENDLYQYSGVAPPYTGSDLTDDIKGAANWKAAARVFSILGFREKRDDAEAQYMKIMGLNKDPSTQEVKVQGGIIGRLKATPTTKTAPTLIAVDPRDSKVILPSQASIFAFDDFA